jgi:hypothetical protein
MSGGFFARDFFEHLFDLDHTLIKLRMVKLRMSGCAGEKQKICEIRCAITKKHCIFRPASA